MQFYIGLNRVILKPELVFAFSPDVCRVFNNVQGIEKFDFLTTYKFFRLELFQVYFVCDFESESYNLIVYHLCIVLC